MPRISREHLDTTFFYVITQGIKRSYICNISEDIKYYIKTMYELEEDNIKIIAYCIMNNHAHILIQVNKISFIKISEVLDMNREKIRRIYNMKEKC